MHPTTAPPLAGLFLATGHYRNGILLVPATASAIADAIEGKPAAELRPFTIERLNAEESAPSRITHA